MEKSQRLKRSKELIKLKRNEISIIVGLFTEQVPLRHRAYHEITSVGIAKTRKSLRYQATPIVNDPHFVQVTLSIKGLSWKMQSKSERTLKIRITLFAATVRYTKYQISAGLSLISIGDSQTKPTVSYVVS